MAARSAPKFTPGDIIRCRDDARYQAACLRLQDHQGGSHGGWKHPRHLFMVVRTCAKGVMLCPIAGDPESGKGLPAPMRLALDEADVIDHDTYLHVALTVIVDPDHIECAKRHPKEKTRCAAFHGPRLVELLKKICMFWPDIPGTPSATAEYRRPSEGSLKPVR